MNTVVCEKCFDTGEMHVECNQVVKGVVCKYGPCDCNGSGFALALFDELAFNIARGFAVYTGKYCLNESINEQ